MCITYPCMVNHVASYGMCMECDLNSIFPLIGHNQGMRGKSPNYPLFFHGHHHRVSLFTVSSLKLIIIELGVTSDYNVILWLHVYTAALPKAMQNICA